VEGVVIEREEGVAFRTLPHNDEAEQALLGALLVNNEKSHVVSGFLRPDHFFQPIHGRIFEAILKLVERGQIANPVTLKHYFENDEALTDIGGAQYLARLVGSTVTIINAEDYARTVHDLYLRRELITLGEDVVNEAYDYKIETPANEQIELAEQHLFNLAEEGESEGGFRPLGDSMTDAIVTMEGAYNRKGGLTGVATGLIDLDNLLGGLHPSDLLILAGRPGMGKSGLATNIGLHAARNYRPILDDDGKETHVEGAVVGFFSLEMSAEQLANRMLSEATGISSEKLRRGQLSREDFHKVVEESRNLSNAPFFIDDTPALSVAALRTRARRLKRTQNLSLIIVDYLQLVRPSGSSRHDSRVLEIGEITQGLKALAKDLNVPVLALSQLSRAVEQREDKRPQLSDLRESGSIEQDADVVMFIFREDYYLERDEPVKRAEETDERHADRYERWTKRLQEVEGTAEVIIAKQRHGPTGKIRLQFTKGTIKFSTLDTQHSVEDAPF
jgi:replicative DNA helicase